MNDLLPKFPTLFKDNESVAKDFLLYKSDVQSDDVIKIPAGINVHLRPYQRQGIRFLFERCFGGFNSANGQVGAILADDMGLGKTVQVIGLIAALLKKTQSISLDSQQCRSIRFGDESPERMFLIISPASVMNNWMSELNTWGTFLVEKFHGSTKNEALKLARVNKIEVVLTTFDTARAQFDDLNRINWDAIIVDEVHKIKESKSRITQALKGFRCKRRIGLTGTLLQNNYDELWCVLDWANPGCLGSSKDFSARFSHVIELGIRFDALKHELARSRRQQEILDKLKSAWVLRRTKDKTISEQLPKKVDQVVYCQPSKFQMNVFQSLIDSDDMKYILISLKKCSCDSGLKGHKCCLRTNSEGMSWKELVVQFIHLFSKAANHVALLLPSNNTSSKVQAKEGMKYCYKAFQNDDISVKIDRNSFLTLSNPKYSGKMQVLVDLLEVLKEEKSKVLLFSYSTTVLSILESFIQSKGYSYRRLDGNVRNDKRTEFVDEFNSDPNIFVFLISTKAGGLGLNITGANIVIVFDPSWNPAHDLQAQDRVYRIGQTRDVKVFRLVTAGSIEEIKYLRQVYKQQLSSNAVDGQKARRYFHGVNNQMHGELFGIRNLFRIRDHGSSLTSIILKRNNTVEDVFKGKKKIEIREDMLDYNSFVFNEDSQESMKSTQKDEHLIDSSLINFLDDEEDEIKSPTKESPKKNLSPVKKTIESILGSHNVVHCHINQDLIGGSRVEEHISKCAIDQVKNDSFISRNEPALLNCATMSISNTQSVSDINNTNKNDCLDNENPIQQIVGKEIDRTVMKGNEPRIVKTESCTFLYGQTPKCRKEMDFHKLAEYLDMSIKEVSRYIISLSEIEVSKLLKEFYINSLGYDNEVISQIYDNVIQEFTDEKEDLDQSILEVISPKKKKSYFKIFDEEEDSDSSNSSFENESPIKSPRNRSPKDKGRSPKRSKAIKKSSESNDNFTDQIDEIDCDNSNNVQCLEKSKDDKGSDKSFSKIKPAPPCTYKNKNYTDTVVEPIKEGKAPKLFKPKPAPKAIYKRRFKITDSESKEESQIFTKETTSQCDSIGEETKSKKPKTIPNDIKTEDDNFFESLLNADSNVSTSNETDDFDYFSNRRRRSAVDELLLKGKIIWCKKSSPSP